MLDVYDNNTASFYLNQRIRWIDVKHVYQISFMMIKAVKGANTNNTTQWKPSLKSETRGFIVTEVNTSN